MIRNNIIYACKYFAWEKLIVFLIFIKGFTLLSFSQNTFNVRVTDVHGQPAREVLVTFDDNYQQMCVIGITDSQGKVSFKVHQIPELVFVYDKRSNPVYGFTSIHINQSRNEYQVSIPFRPTTRISLLQQVENVYEIIRRFYGYYSTFDFIDRALKNSKPLGYGVPGIFSISPLPKFEGGKAYLEVSGQLADFIFGFYQYMMIKAGELTGNEAIYLYQIGPQAY